MNYKKGDKIFVRCVDSCGNNHFTNGKVYPAFFERSSKAYGLWFCFVDDEGVERSDTLIDGEYAKWRLVVYPKMVASDDYLTKLTKSLAKNLVLQSNNTVSDGKFLEV